MTQPQPVRALALARECLPKSKDADYILRILETKARRAEAKASAKEKGVVTRKLLRAAGQRPIGKSGLLREADIWFGRFIKLRDTKDYPPDHGRNGFCVTCRKFLPLSSLQCGHWIRRENWSTRFDEKNSHAQCEYCNGFCGGKEKEHEEFIQKKYGQDVRDRFLLLKKMKGRTPTVTALQNIATTYRAKCNELGGWPEKSF